MGLEKQINGHPFVRYEKETRSAEEMEMRSQQFYELLQSRRSVRDFSSQPISKKIIENRP